MDDPASAPVSRRRLLAAAGVATVGSLAGCLGGDDDESEVEPIGTFFDHPGDEFVEFDSSHQCGVCAMGVTGYSERNAQLAHASGDGMSFCSPGCLFAYASAPEGYAAPDDEFVGVWVTDFATGEIVDGFDASYVVDPDDQRADAPMGSDPQVYAEEDAALEYVDQYDDLDETDVIAFADVGEAEAQLYRPNRLP